MILLKREYEYLSPDFWGCSDYDFSHKSLESSCDIFQWVHLNGCPWSDRTYKELKSHQNKGEYKDQNKWAFKNGCRRINVPVTQACRSTSYPLEQSADMEQEDEEEEDNEEE